MYFVGFSVFVMGSLYWGYYGALGGGGGGGCSVALLDLIG